jgi:hypothetical protein
MLDPCFKGSRLVIQYVGKEKIVLIASEYDMYVLFPSLVHAYKFLNPFVASETVVASTSTNSKMNNSRVRSFYDLMGGMQKAHLHGGKLMNHNFLMLFL